MNWLSRFCVFLYAAALLVIGGIGVFFAETELTRVFSVDLDQLEVQKKATILNQYRFLKGIEFAVGVICITHRKQIFSAMEPAKAFLLVVFAGVFARSFSVLVDGTPSWPFLMFLAGELLVGVVIGFDVWRRRAAHA
jgi:NADH:ubiquinone oxidoreductase subunit K